MKVVSKVVLIAVVCCFAISVSAQEVGLAKDGRAYRKSADGFKIKDHIAELEVEIDGLKRQVYSLEDELKEKNQTINKLTGGKGAPKPTLKESTLVSGQNVRPAVASSTNSCSALQAKVNMLELTLKRVNRVGATEVAFEAERNNIQRCQNELSQTKQSLASMSSQVDRLQGALMDGPSEKTLEKERELSVQLEKQLAKVRSELTNAERNKESALGGLNSKIAKLQAEIDAEKQRSMALESEAEQAKSQVASLQKQLAGSSSSRTETMAKRASLTPQRGIQRATKKSKKNVVTQASVSKSKAMLNEQLRAVQSLIIKRKDRLDVLKKRNKSVGIKIQSLKTKQGRSLDSIRVEVRRLSDPGEQFQLASEIEQIKKLLEQDIALLTRLGKL